MTSALQRIRPFAPYLFFGSLGLGFLYDTLHKADLTNLESNPVCKSAVYTLRHDERISPILGDSIHLVPHAMTKGIFSFFCLFFVSAG